MLASATFPKESIWALYLPYKANEAKGWIEMCVFTKGGPLAVASGEVPAAGGKFQLSDCSNTIENWPKVAVILKDDRCGSGMTFNYATGTCTDVDECLLNPCGQNAVCTNSRGSFSCTCEEGYGSNGRSCVDIDECDIETDDCSKEHGTCENKVGSFVCGCERGWEITPSPSNNTCVNIDECDADVVARL